MWSLHQLDHLPNVIALSFQEKCEAIMCEVIVLEAVMCEAIMCEAIVCEAGV